MITPRSESISSGWRAMKCDQSCRISSALSMMPSREVGTSFIMYEVMSQLVPALRLAPNFTPTFSRYSIICLPGRFFVPLKAMCSRKWARPCCASFSWMAPTSCRMWKSACPFGFSLWRM